MLINGVDLYDNYGARITQFTEQPLSMTKEVFYPKGKLMPVVLDKIVQAKQMYLELDFRNKENIFRLLPVLTEEFILELDYEPEYVYRCQILSFGNNVALDDYDSYTVGFDVVVVKEGFERVVCLEAVESQVFANPGTCESDAIYIITANDNVENFMINEIKIRQLDGGETITIHGEDKRIVLGTETNGFERCELYSFPKVQAGVNEVRMSNYENVSVQVRYKPVYF